MPFELPPWPQGAQVIDSRTRLLPGLEDNTARLSLLLDEAHSTGLPLWLPPGRDIVSKAIAKGYSPWIIGNGARIIAPEGKSAEAGAPNALWSFAGSTAEIAKTTAEVAEGSKVIPVATAGLRVGDLIKIGEKAPYYTNASEATRYRGQLATVKSIDSGAQLTVCEAAYHSFATASTVWKVTPLLRPRVHDLTFLDPNSASPTDYLGGLAVRYGVDIDLSIGAEANSAGGLILRDCYHGLARFRGKSSVWINANEQFGYGVDLQLANVGLEVHADCSGGGPACTTNGYNEEYGEPIHCDIYARNHGALYGSALETHAAGRWVRFIEPDVDGCPLNGIITRAPDTEIIGGTFRNCGENGAYLNDNCSGTKLRATRIEASALNGVFVQPAAARSGIDLTGVQIKKAGRSGIRTVGALEDSVIKGCTIRAYAGLSESGERYGIRFGAACTRTYVQENAFADPVGGANQCVLWVAASTTCSVERNAGINIPGAEAFPVVAGVTAAGNTEV